MLTVLQGDAMEKLRELPHESAQCCVTSPPYWGLRDYGTAEWEGGDIACDHSTPRSRGEDIREGEKQGASKGSRPNTQRICYCGAKRIDAQIGLEETPDAYVAKMVEVFREVRRVLRGDGTLWLNLGDSYISTPSGSKGYTAGFRNGSHYQANCKGIKVDGLKPKDLCGMPWRVAFALQADGWYLRSDIIWHKPNPMPESVTDRPTKAHEYLFLLSKRDRYFYDAEAIKEPLADATIERGYTRAYMENAPCKMHASPDEVRAKGNWRANTYIPESRNKRSVWTVASAPYSEAHFATYPPDLIKPCILAGTKVGDTVLDPFAGSGTTGMVAIELGRKAILIELNPDYVKLIERRCMVTPGFL